MAAAQDSVLDLVRDEIISVLAKWEAKINNPFGLSTTLILTDHEAALESLDFPLLIKNLTSSYTSNVLAAYRVYREYKDKIESCLSEAGQTSVLKKTISYVEAYYAHEIQALFQTEASAYERAEEIPALTQDELKELVAILPASLQAENEEALIAYMILANQHHIIRTYCNTHDYCQLVVLGLLVEAKYADELKALDITNENNLSSDLGSFYRESTDKQLFITTLKEQIENFCTVNPRHETIKTLQADLAAPDSNLGRLFVAQPSTDVENRSALAAFKTLDSASQSGSTATSTSTPCSPSL